MQDTSTYMINVRKYRIHIRDNILKKIRYTVQRLMLRIVCRVQQLRISNYRTVQPT